MLRSSFLFLAAILIMMVLPFYVQDAQSQTFKLKNGAQLKLEFSAKDIWFARTGDQVTSISSPHSNTAGLFISLEENQQVTFFKKGDKFVCPGKLYIGLAGNPDKREFTGGLDWAFVVSKALSVPNWVEDSANAIISDNPNNVFLIMKQKIEGRIFILGPLVSQKGQLIFKIK
jgi:hypothetical protein